MSFGRTLDSADCHEISEKKGGVRPGNGDVNKLFKRLGIFESAAAAAVAVSDPVRKKTGRVGSEFSHRNYKLFGPFRERSRCIAALWENGPNLPRRFPPLRPGF